ncbi:hypothetical protein [Mycolicibacterium sp. 120270]|uniref:hypothetical protein n=1 Tax=Mycolicibacterium sp. 120270 TaxID=3090600 RepID=UPI00299DA574|nr:hypothetical protein [Mycolicibacterium sp. 120270]MDX1882690.1 hypothetical protein [Mycolicibacterium sp. 120270]
MAEEDIVDAVNRLELEAKKALLEKVIALADGVNLNRVEELSRAYALVVGAARGGLPGGPVKVVAS